MTDLLLADEVEPKEPGHPYCFVCAFVGFLSGLLFAIKCRSLTVFKFSVDNEIRTWLSIVFYYAKGIKLKEAKMGLHTIHFRLQAVTFFFLDPPAAYKPVRILRIFLVDFVFTGKALLLFKIMHFVLPMI